MRVGVGSFEPRDRVKEPTVALARRRWACDAVRFQGNWIPHQLRQATADGVFFVGDSAGHCLPLTAEGIRPAFYFALALGASCARSSPAALTREQALARYGAFSAGHRRQLREHARRPAPGRADHRHGRDGGAVRAVSRRRLARWIFEPLPRDHAAAVGGRSARTARAPRAADRAALGG